MEKTIAGPECSLSRLETGALVFSGLFLIVLCIAFLPVVGILVAIPVMVMALSFLFPKAQDEKAARNEESEEPLTLFDLPVSAKGPRFSVEGPRIDSNALAAFTGRFPAEARK